MSYKFINTIERLAQSKHLRSGDVIKATEEILKESASTLNCERVNAWTLNNEGNTLNSIKSYISSTNKYSIDPTLESKSMPDYFKGLKKETIITSNNAKTLPINQELLPTYIIPFNITSMIDVPIRSEGKMIGVICFEHVNQKHEWSLEEQKFTQSIAQLLSLALESFEKKSYREKLERIISEKEVLISEVNHRVKNNMAVIISLLKLQKQSCKDDFHQNMFEDVINRVYSMSAIQNRLHSSQNFSEINLETYLSDLVSNINNTYGGNKNISIDLNLTPILIDMTKAVPCGLIINEILTNSFKYAFTKNNKTPLLSVTCKSLNKKVYINIKDNGPGFKQKDKNSSSSMGLELIESLTSQIDGEFVITSNKGVDFSLTF